MTVPSEFIATLFVGTGQYPHLDEGDIFTFIIKDHASHMASACVVLNWMPD